MNLLGCGRTTLPPEVAFPHAVCEALTASGIRADVGAGAAWAARDWQCSLLHTHDTIVGVAFVATQASLDILQDLARDEHGPSTSQAVFFLRLAGGSLGFTSAKENAPFILC